MFCLVYGRRWEQVEGQSMQQEAGGGVGAILV